MGYPDQQGRRFCSLRCRKLQAETDFTPPAASATPSKTLWEPYLPAGFAAAYRERWRAVLYCWSHRRIPTDALVALGGRHHERFAYPDQPASSAMVRDLDAFLEEHK